MEHEGSQTEGDVPEKPLLITPYRMSSFQSSEENLFKPKSGTAADYLQMISIQAYG